MIMAEHEVTEAMVNALELARYWLANCQPLVEPDADHPLPLPIIDRAISTISTGAGADADARDAARYRWLRDHIHYCRDDEHTYPYATVKVYFDRDERGSVSRITVWPCDGVGAASLNTAIDAAMLASSPQQRAGDRG
jgi:hypothetical protein